MKASPLGYFYNGVSEDSNLFNEMFLCIITKTRLYNFDPLEPHFYIVKLGFAGVCNIFLISGQNIDCGYSLEPPRRGRSNEYQQSLFWAEIRKISDFFSEIFHFLVVKFSVHLNRHVFVMTFHTLVHVIRTNLGRTLFLRLIYGRAV